MGEYWKPVNLTKKEFVHPHRLDCGLKLAEWNHPDSRVLRRIEELVASGEWDHSDKVAIVSDYGGTIPLEPFTALTNEESLLLYEIAGETYMDVSKGD